MLAIKQDKKTKVSSILISQPKPDSKSPYFEIAKKYKVKIDFRPFIHIEDIPAREFRKSRIKLYDYSTIIFTSRNAIDHFFRICNELRVNMSQETRYVCISEAVALYLQKYILYRKRKVSFGNGTSVSVMELIEKQKKTGQILFPCSNIHKKDIPDFLTKNNFDFDEAVIYKTVASDLSDLKEIKYDMIIFFSPSGVRSLFQNFPDFNQDNTRIAAFGPTTSKSVIKAGLRLEVQAPMPQAPSMTMALERYLKKMNS